MRDDNQVEGAMPNSDFNDRAFFLMDRALSDRRLLWVLLDRAAVDFAIDEEMNTNLEETTCSGEQREDYQYVRDLLKAEDANPTPREHILYDQRNLKGIMAEGPA